MKPRRVEPPFKLTHPEPVSPVCKACGKTVKDMKRHAGTEACTREARRAMIERMGLVEVWFRESRTLTTAGVAVVVIRDRKRGESGKKRDQRRWYASPQPVRALRMLTGSGIPDKRAAALLSGPPEELERELAVIALSGRVGSAGGAAPW